MVTKFAPAVRSTSCVAKQWIYVAHRSASPAVPAANPLALPTRGGSGWVRLKPT